MKRIFEEPDIDIVSIEVEDVVTTSGEGNTGEFDGEWVPLF